MIRSTAQIKRKLWNRIYGEASWVDRHGSFRDREQFGLISRANYLYGMLRAADCAKYFGNTSVTVIEFGVADGAGLLNMVDLAALIQAETGVGFRIVGFDTGKGLPHIKGYKDHPEIWNPGDFSTDNKDKLMRRLEGRAEVIWGDIADTVDVFTTSIDPASPIGFISVDVDIYSATKSALRCLMGQAEQYIPAVSMYFDDVSFFFANKWCGELAAIEQFNAEHEMRKIGSDRSLPGHRPKKADSWYSSMYVCHVLDHKARQQTVSRNELAIDAHADFMKSRFLF